MRRVAMGVAVMATIALLAATGLWAAQRRLIYFPDGSAPDDALVPSGWQPVAYPTTDGLTLHAWYRPPDPGRPVVIVFNGNAGNRAGRLTLGEGLAASGLGVLLTDYRGYGGNPGHPGEAGLARDARAALDFATHAAPASPLVYFGESLGAAVAVELATHRPPAALVLRSPFTSLADVGRVHYPWLPIGRFLKDRYPSLERIGGVRAPLLVIAGDADGIVPTSQSERLFAAARQPEEFLLIAGADHNDVALTAGAELIDAIVTFLAAHA